MGKIASSNFSRSDLLSPFSLVIVWEGCKIVFAMYVVQGGQDCLIRRVSELLYMVAFWNVIVSFSFVKKNTESVDTTFLM